MMADLTTTPPLRWYFFTRALGVFILLFGVLYDDTSDRGTLILTGAGLLGLDKVVRTDKAANGA